MDNTFITQFKNIGMLVLGALILVIHAVIFNLNQYMFTIIMCIYIIGYTILVIVIMYKYRTNLSISDFNILMNMSFYTLFLELFLILLRFGFMFYRSSK